MAKSKKKPQEKVESLIRKGDVVTLKSDGQRMTVEEIQAGGKVSCLWIHSGKVVREALDADLLKLAEEPAAPFTLEDLVRGAGGAPDAGPTHPGDDLRKRKRL
jgi:uncharacterized protein YodC (DUF2158 family)